MIRRYGWIAAAVLLCGAVLMVVGIRAGNRRAPDPRFGGRSITEWIESADFTTNRAAVELAVVALGESSVPALQRMLRSGNRLERVWFAWAPRWLYRRFPIGGYQFDRKDRAMWALQTLGRTGRPATPALLAILKDPTEHWNQRSRALSTLRYVETKSDVLIPALEKLTNDPAMRRLVGMELALIRQSLPTERDQEIQKAFSANVSGRKEGVRPEFRPATSLLENVSLYGTDERRRAGGPGRTNQWDTFDRKASPATNR